MPKLKVTANSGQLYFPGDTAVSYVLTSSDGSPVDPSVLHVLLIRPDGTNVTLKAVRVGLGVFRASYVIPGGDPLGTYVLIIDGQNTGMSNGGSIDTFQVKPSWIVANGQQVVSVIGIAGMIGTLGLASYKGYLKKRGEE
jgi:hypothetical protein